jgi:hypothetical protein
MMFLFTAEGVLRRPFRHVAGVAGYAFALLVGLAAVTSSTEQR